MDRLVSALAVLALGACSLSITAPAANRKRNQVPICDSGKGMVAIDALGAIGFGVGGLAALSEDQGTGAIALVGAALFTAAALHGSSNADKCREAFNEYAKETHFVVPPVDEIVRRPRRRTTREPEPEDPDQVDAREEPPVTELPAKLPSQVGHKPEPKPEPEPRPSRRPAQDDWSQFWREVP